MSGPSKYDLVPYTKGRGLQIGGEERLFPHFVMADESVLDIFADGAFDFVVVTGYQNKDFCRLVKVGGFVCSFEKTITIWQVKADGLSWVEQGPPTGKAAAVVRYGAFGDMIQASSVFPGLKKQGYHLTVYTSEKGYEISKHDPHVDRWIVQETDQVPISELGAFCRREAEKYSKFIHLSESVEASLVAIPERVNYKWPKSARHRLMNHNYLEFTHEIAQVPFEPMAKFYATDAEKKWARKKKRKMNAPVIVWVMSGSGIEKTWPHLDTIIARIMVALPHHVVFVGDEISQLLEVGWEKEPRVHMKCGKWTIRETIAFAQQADMVIGPDTGVMNAVGLEDMPKIICMSHASPENVSKHWVNTTSLEPDGCLCYPCHRLPFTFENCSRDEQTGAAECQAKIGPEKMWEAILETQRRAA